MTATLATSRPAALANAREPGDARIGPNAITRLDEALAARMGEARRDDVFKAAGLHACISSPPRSMVAEDDVRRLHRALADVLAPSDADVVASEAGRLTALYLLAYRIPRMAQHVLHWLPRRIALSLLLKAIGKHAWTFAGSGHFSYVGRPRLTLLIGGGLPTGHDPAHALARRYLSATFEGVLSGATGRRFRVTSALNEAGTVTRFDVVRCAERVQA